MKLFSNPQNIIFGKGQDLYLENSKMPEIYELTAETRTNSGKGNSRRLRRLKNKVPAIIYGGDKNPTAIIIDHNVFAHALENGGFYSHILTLSVDGKAEKVVLKDLHRHPSEPKILHADFMRISAKTKLTMHIPVHFSGEESVSAVKDQGGIVSHHMNEVEVRCLPADLPESIEVDVSNLEMGDAIHLSGLKLPKGVELIALLQGEEFDQPVVSIHKPHVVVEEVIEEAAVAAEEAAKEAAEGSATEKPEG
jgi:large subunit ribosomal protein L25